LRELTAHRPVPLVAAASALIAILAVCASPGIPPGGPVDRDAPQLVDIAPDSGATATTPRAAVFRFNEVVSERPSGVPSLNALFLISPREGTPDVDWNREEVAVRPSRGWRRNTAYTITMLPGMSDLRGNVRNAGAVLVFSTGSEIPQSRIGGTVYNWLTGSLAPRAFVEVRPVADTTIAYVAATDTAGRFVVSNVAPGSYLVRAFIDDNSNRGLDPREAWDSVSVALTDTAGVEMFVFPHDSVGARLSTVGLRDSVTLELLFDHAIDVNQRFDQASVSIRRSDSVDIPVISVSKPQLAADTAAGVAPRPSRPIPSTSLVVRIGTPIKTRTTLRIRTIGVRGLEGIPFTTDRVVIVEPPPQRPAPQAPATAPAARPGAPPAPPPPPPAAPSLPIRS